MNELVPVLETLVREVESGRPAALCTVVKTHGSTPRGPGTAMLVRADGTTVGTVGGGQVEAATRRVACELLTQNRSSRFDSALDHDCQSEDGMICGGQVQVAITTYAATAQLDPIRMALAAAHRRQAARIPLLIEHAGQTLEYGLHVEVPPTLVVAGAGHVGQAVAKLGGDLGFRVVVIDDRADLLAAATLNSAAERIAGDIAATLADYPLDASCYVVIVTRGHQYDLQALQAVIERPTAYIGMMGSRRKVAAVLAAVAQAGVSQDCIDRVHAPIGLPIGGVTVPELAVSIGAELIQVRRKVTPKLVDGPREVESR